MGSGESAFIKDLSDVNQGFDERECRQIFDAFDKDKTGYLPRDAGIKFLTKYAKVKKLANPRQFAETTFARLDTNNDGRLAFSELLKKQATSAPSKEVKASPSTAPSSTTPPTTASSSSSSSSSSTYSSPSAAAAPQVSSSTAAEVFALMTKDTADGTENVMVGDSLDKFFSAVGISPDGIMTLGISWKFECKTMGEISKNEFTKGCDKTKCRSVEDIKRLVETTEKALKTDSHQFKQFYMWVFDFAKEGEERKTLDTETALDMWGLVLVHHFALLPKWLQFVQDAKINTVTKDIWAQLIEFAFQVKGGLQNWQDDGSWPVLIDEFAQHCGK